MSGGERKEPPVGDSHTSSVDSHQHHALLILTILIKRADPKSNANESSGLEHLVRGYTAKIKDKATRPRINITGVQRNIHLSLLTPTRVAGVKRSSASDCVSVCPRDRTKTAETTITKLASGIVHSSPWYPFNIRSKGQRSQGNKVQKHISGDRVAGVSLHSMSAQRIIMLL